MPNYLVIFKLLIDFSLLTLIFMVQLSTYPSFLYFERKNLVKWHRRYTKVIAGIVGPLMIMQLALSIYFVLGKSQYILGGIHLIFVVAIWISTALQFVPIHNRIANNTYSAQDLEKLVKRNWIRVVLWLLTFLISLLHCWAIVNLTKFLS